MHRAVLLTVLLLAACSDSDTASETEAAAANASLAVGDACPPVSAEAAQPRSAGLTSGASLNGVAFARESGSSSCRIGDGGDIVCAMSSPGLVRVTGASGSAAYFDIPAGRGATVSMSGDIARCVLN